MVNILQNLTCKAYFCAVKKRAARQEAESALQTVSKMNWTFVKELNSSVVLS